MSRAGAIPCSWSLDHAGAITRTVEDTALVLQVIAGDDPLDSTTLQTPVPDYTGSLMNDVKNMVIGIPDTQFFNEVDPEIALAFNQSLLDFQELGVRIVSVSLPKNLEDANQAHRIVMKAEAACYHQDHYPKNHTLYNPQLRQELELGQLVSAVDYLRAQHIRAAFRNELVDLLEGVDAIITPATPTPAPQGLSYTGSPAFNIPFTNAGVPSLTLPNGFTETTRLPLGLQLVARPLGEERLIKLGHAYQSITDWHKERPRLAFIK
ncbi:amidase [Aneurinibacillus tyrosinisolvens]|uniref:amidase n=1 Tax=Aneurinibacillus tyrosinisolvens TaxID=1443435 RepID=UPI0022A9C1CB|nr:amidase family protein [Aneurinibacillus tyrosinisolvens]